MRILRFILILLLVFGNKYVFGQNNNLHTLPSTKINKPKTPSNKPLLNPSIKRIPTASGTPVSLIDTTPKATPKGDPINCQADIANFISIHGKTVGHFRSNGHPCRFYQGNANMTSDSALYFQDENRLNAFGHVVIHQADTVTITGDSLHYDGNTRLAQLYYNITMTDPKGVLTTDHLNYDLNTKVGTYFDGGKIHNKDNILISRTGYYYENTKDAYFKNNVTILTPETTIKSDTMHYNTITRISYFFGPTRITGKDDFIYCENGEYHTITDQAKFSKNAYYLTGSKKLVGDSLYYNKREGYGRAVRHVVFTDSVEKTVLYGGLAVYNKSTQITYATIDPLFIMPTHSTDTINSYTDTLKHFKLDVTKPIYTQLPPLNPKVKNNLPQGKIVLDTLIALDVFKKNGKKSKEKAYQRFIRTVEDKIDSVYLTGDTLKTVIVTGNAAKPNFSKVKLNLVKTSSDSLEKRAGRLMAQIKQEVKLDSLKKLPGYRSNLIISPIVVENSNKEIDVNTITNKKVKKLIAKKNELINLQNVPKKDTLSTGNVKIRNKIIADSISTHRSRDSVASKKKVHIGFFARLFGGKNRQKAPPDSNLIKKHILDSLSHIKKPHIPDLLDGLPYDSCYGYTYIFPVKKYIAIKDTAHFRMLFAYHHAKMFKSDLQSAADSMIYTYYDSTIRSYTHPVIWSQGSQMSSDSLTLKFKNQKLDSLLMIHSSFIISKLDTVIKLEKFDQISGRNMFGKFINNNLKTLFVDGNAKSLYYATDDKKDSLGRIHSKLIGMNSTIASYFTIRFSDNHPRKIVAEDKPDSHFYPLKKLSPGKERLSGFFWRESQRPKSKTDIFRQATAAEIAVDTAINNKTPKVDSLDDSSPNILEVPRAKPKPKLKKGKAKDIDSLNKVHADNVNLSTSRLDSLPKTKIDSLKINNFKIDSIRKGSISIPNTNGGIKSSRLNIFDTNPFHGIIKTSGDYISVIYQKSKSKPPRNNFSG